MPFKPKHILVPTDESSNAEAALNTAVAIAQQNDADISLLEVVAPMYSAPEYPLEDVSAQLQQRADGYLKRLAKSVADKTGFTNIKTTVIHDAPKPTIAKYFPEQHDIDLIVIGATGTNAFERAILGSTTGYVVREAVVNVLVVKDEAN